MKKTTSYVLAVVSVLFIIAFAFIKMVEAKQSHIEAMRNYKEYKEVKAQLDACRSGR